MNTINKTNKKLDYLYYELKSFFTNKNNNNIESINTVLNHENTYLKYQTLILILTYEFYKSKNKQPPGSNHIYNNNSFKKTLIDTFNKLEKQLQAKTYKYLKHYNTFIVESIKKYFNLNIIYKHSSVNS